MMKFKRLLTGVVVASAMISTHTFAAEGADKAAMAEVLSKYRLDIESVNALPIEGMYEVVTNGGIIYSNKDGSYFIHGQLFHTTDTESVNITEVTQAKRNKALFEAADVEKELIVFPAKDEKYVVNVFTDTTCGYCVKLHSEMQQYNDAGITVRYLAFPRSGERSPNIKQMSAIWCAEDKAQAMNDAKARKFNEESDKCTDMVRRHMALGSTMGVSGTPAIMLEDGTMLGGYVPADRLKAMLEQKFQG